MRRPRPALTPQLGAAACGASVPASTSAPKHRGRVLPPPRRCRANRTSAARNTRRDSNRPVGYRGRASNGAGGRLLPAGNPGVLAGLGGHAGVARHAARARVVVRVPAGQRVKAQQRGRAAQGRAPSGTRRRRPPCSTG